MRQKIGHTTVTVDVRTRQERERGTREKEGTGEGGQKEERTGKREDKARGCGLEKCA